MDELLNDFLIETNEHIEAAGDLLVAFEREPSNKGAITKIFRLVHTIKGTCGFLGLSRLEHLTHVTEALIGRLRDGAPAAPETVSAILASVDRVKFILGWLEKTGKEPEGNDTDLIDVLQLRIITLGAPLPSVDDFAAAIEVEDWRARHRRAESRGGCQRPRAGKHHEPTGNDPRRRRRPRAHHAACVRTRSDPQPALGTHALPRRRGRQAAVAAAFRTDVGSSGCGHARPHAAGRTPVHQPAAADARAFRRAQEEAAARHRGCGHGA